MRKIRAFFLGVLLFAGVVQVYAGEFEDNINNSLAVIDENLAALFEAGVHDYDKGRIFILRKAVTKVQDNLNSYGPIHFKSQNSFFNLLVKFRFSSSFFDFIKTGVNSGALTEIMSEVNNIKEYLGADDMPYISILMPNLERISEIIRSLIKNKVLNEEHRGSLVAQLPALGNAIALASQGDRPSAFDAAVEVASSLRDICVALEDVLVYGPETTSLYLELLGLNEFIAEYSELN